MVSYAKRPGRIVIVSASVGAGHDGAAAEFARRFTASGHEVHRYDFLDLLPPTMGRLTRSSYKMALKAAPSSWEWALERMNHGSRLGSGATWYAGLARRRLLRAVADEPDVIVSTYPMASQALGQLRAAGRVDTPVVTFLTDMSVHPQWVHPGVDLHLALHDVAAGQARALGATDVRLVTPLVRPLFAPLVEPETQAGVRARFGLPESGPLALVVAGSWGVGEIEESVRDIAATGLATPVVSCGRNGALESRITRSGLGHALGWVTDMPGLISACDVVVQNAGGLTSLEALTAGAPVITYRCLVGHGRTNAAALDQAGWVPWVTHAADLPAALHRALSAGPRGRSPFPGTDPVATVRAALGLAGGPEMFTAASAAGPDLFTAAPPVPAGMEASEPAPVRAPA